MMRGWGHHVKTEERILELDLDLRKGVMLRFHFYIIPDSPFLLTDTLLTDPFCSSIRF
jgi:hypothetical protein